MWNRAQRVAWCVVASVLVLSGCGGGGKPAADNRQDDEDVKVATYPCEQRMEGLVQAAQPVRLGLTSDPRLLANDINGWRLNCGSRYVLHEKLPEGAAKLLSEELKGRMAGEEYTEEDILQVGDAYWGSSVAKRISAAEKDDVRRVVEAFQFVVRTIAPFRDGSASGFPQRMNESLLFGQGSAEDRAWAFAEIVRQMRMDCVIIEPAEAGKRWLVGVIVPKQGTVLFDPHLGLAIPGGKETGERALVTQPATLKEVQENDALLRKLDGGEGQAYPLMAGDLKSVNVKLVVTANGMSGRMGRMQLGLPAAETVVLHDGLGASELREKGLYERVVAAGAEGGWTEERVGIWKYPEEQLEKCRKITTDQKSQRERRMVVFRAPDISDVVEKAKEEAAKQKQTRQPGEEMGSDPSDGPITGRTLKMHDGRIMHVLGDFGAAMEVYLRTRLSNQEIAVNRSGAELASFWVGACQIEQKQYARAKTTLEMFLKQHSTSRMSEQARFLLAVTNYELGAKKEAVEMLQRATQTELTRVLMKRWGEGAAAPTEKPVGDEPKQQEPPKKEESPSEEKPS